MLHFKQERFHSRIVLPNGLSVDRPIEIRTHPITGRTCRITYSRGEEREPGTETLPAPPPFASDREKCPFCLCAGRDQYPAISARAVSARSHDPGDLHAFSEPLSLRALFRGKPFRRRPLRGDRHRSPATLHGQFPQLPGLSVAGLIP